MLYQLSYSRLLCPVWWRGEDSNLRRLRRQIYSLLPLATREPLHKKISLAVLICGKFLNMELAMGFEPATC